MAEHIFHNLSALRPGDNNSNTDNTAAEGDDPVDADMATHSGDNDVMAAQSDDDSDTMSIRSDDSDAMDTQSIGGYDTVATQYDDLDDDLSGTDSDSSEDEDMIDDVLPPQFYTVHPNNQAAGGQSPPFGGHWFEVDSDDETDGQSMAVNSGTNNTAATAPARPVQTREVVLVRAVPRGFVTISDPSVPSASLDEDQYTGGNIAARRRIGEGVAMELVISVSDPLVVTTADSVLFSPSSSSSSSSAAAAAGGDSDSFFVPDQGTTTDDTATTTATAAVHDERQEQQQQQQHQRGMMDGTVGLLIQLFANFNAIIMTLTPAQLLSGPQELRDNMQQLLTRIEDLRVLLVRSNLGFPAVVEMGRTNEQHDHHGEEDETVKDT